MEKVKEQKVVVLLSLDKSDKNLILNGIKIASIFRKELCLLYNFSKNKKNKPDDVKSMIKEYIVPVKKELPALKVSSLILSEKLLVLPEKLADDFEAIVIISGKSAFKKYSKSLTESSIPFLFINEKNENVSEFKNLILPIDFRSESSDSSLWSSYFGRYNDSHIIVIAATDKGKDEKNKVSRNVALTKKLYLKFNIKHKIYKGTRSSFRNAFESLELALSSECDLLIILGSSSITPLDWIVGLPERKIIEQAGNLPVLIVNPRKDNYILCD